MAASSRKNTPDELMSSIDTLVVSSQLEDEYPASHPLVMPIFLQTTVASNSIEDYFSKEYGYIRYNNPTRSAAECTISALEGGAGSLLFTSGMAAISTVFMSHVHAGDHVIMPINIYSGTHMLLEKYWAPAYDVEISWVDATRGVAEYRKHIRKNTKLLYAETPANPSMTVLNLLEFGRLGSTFPRLITVVDGTFASPYLQQPIKYGIDISIHSCTKYMGGHSDLLAGCLTFRTLELCREFKEIQTELGNALSPWIASLLLRGLRTLPLRMERHSSNAQHLAEYLQRRPEGLFIDKKVRVVHYPGLVSHPDHLTAKKQMSMFGGMITFEMKGGLKSAKHLVENLRLIRLAVSLGGVESLIEHPASMTHGPKYMDDQARLCAGITDGLIRFSVGVENVKDLEKDLQQAFDSVSELEKDLNQRNVSEQKHVHIITRGTKKDSDRPMAETDVNRNII